MSGWTINAALEMLTEIKAQSKYITLDKGAYYLFGGGLFFLLMSLIVPVGHLVPDSKAKKYSKYFMTLMLASVALVFILPHAVHYFTEKHVFADGYEICEARSKQWLHAKTIVYSKVKPCE